MDTGKGGGENKAMLLCDMFYMLHGVLLHTGGSQTVAIMCSCSCYF